MHSGSSAPHPLYRETIRYPAEGERKYIRYYEGRGHFGHVRLRLIPCPGKACKMSLDAACDLPEDCCQAIESVLMRRFDMELRSCLPLIGFEVCLIGGHYLDRHSYPEAYARAACMAFDEALRRACPVTVEPYMRASLLVELDDLVWTVKALGAFLGEMHITQRVTNVVHLTVDVPVRLAGTIRSMGMRVTKQLPVSSDERYRPILTPRTGDALPDDLDEWT